MELRSGSDGMDSINRKAVAIFILIVLVVLALAVWGGTFLGKSQAATKTEELNTSLTTAQDQVSQLRSVSDSLLRDNDTLQTNLASVQGQLSQLQSQYSSLQDRNSALQTQLTSAQQNIANLQSQLASSQQMVATLRSQLASSQQDIAALQSQLTSAQQNNASLQAQLAAWYVWSHNAPPSPGMALSLTSGPGGTTITVTGSNFLANTSGNVFFDINRNGASDSGEPIQNVATSATGTFSTTLVIPTVPPGVYPVLAAFPVGAPAQASATFSVTGGQ